MQIEGVIWNSNIWARKVFELFITSENIARKRRTNTCAI